MSRSEKSILAETLVVASGLPRTLIYRQNAGKAWQGKGGRVAPGLRIITEPGMVILRHAAPIELAPEGAGDFVGICDGQPIQAEAKTLTGRQRPGQFNFQERWEIAGGRYIVFRSPEEFLDGLRGR